MSPPPEAFLAYLWQFQAFDRVDLRTEQGEALHVLQPGQVNAHAGADVQNARVLIGAVEWAGAVEFHRRASDWFLHQHERDAAYENVILHVVWLADTLVRHRDGTEVPTLALAPRTDARLLHRYQALLDSREVIPCASQFARVPELTRLSMLDKALMQRLEDKAEAVSERLRANGQDWEETAWQTLAVAFGFHLNAEPMRRLAEALPLKILQKHRGNLPQLEALVFGTAGLLPEAPPDDYTRRLHQEFDFLQKKYGLSDRVLGAHEWKFLRLRPANFPTVRLAQLAHLVDGLPGIFSHFVQTESLDFLKNNLPLGQSVYWQSHYRFGVPAARPVPEPGRVALDGLLINAAAPLLAAYAHERADPRCLDRALALLDGLPAEKNHLTDQWKTLGLRIRSAADSQGAIEWHNTFCARKRCLSCAVGVNLLSGDVKKSPLSFY